MEKAGRTAPNAVSIWLWSGAGLILLMLVIGGITRLTGSGLSITDWNLLLGVFPPADHDAWLEAFNRYKQFPEYRQLNAGMTLSEFKSIYFWEYLHRLTGRLIGIAFLAPFLWFWYRGYFNRSQIRKLSALFLLGAVQGAMGWIMVKSGLADLPYVSHYRLAAHLLLGFLLFGFCVWLALEWGEAGKTGLRAVEEERARSEAGSRKWLYAIAALLLLQVVWGAFVAGLKAGYIYNSFPLMNGRFMPVHAGALEPLLVNLVDNPGLVQWMHRILGTVLTLAVIAFWMRIVWRPSAGKMSQSVVHLLLGLVLLQYGLGVATLLYRVPVLFGITHQLLALIIFGTWVVLYFREKRPRFNYK